MEGGRIIQCGTPQEIFTRPANAYVADFVAHMNPLGVLCARDVMQAGTELGGPAETVAPDCPVREIMERLAGGAETLAVAEGGGVIGRVSGADVFARLLDPGRRDGLLSRDDKLN